MKHKYLALILSSFFIVGCSNEGQIKVDELKKYMNDSMIQIESSSSYTILVTGVFYEYRIQKDSSSNYSYITYDNATITQRYYQKQGDNKYKIYSSKIDESGIITQSEDAITTEPKFLEEYKQLTSNATYNNIENINKIENNNGELQGYSFKSTTTSDDFKTLTTVSYKNSLLEYNFSAIGLQSSYLIIKFINSSPSIIF